MSRKNSEQAELSYAELLQQNRTLRQEIEALNQQSVYLWGVYAETSRKLQIYSASIKAAVSSLLNRDIFWDGANQLEFLTTINASVNQVSDLTILLTLAFRAEAGSLILRREPQALQEILSMAQASAQAKFPDLRLQVTCPQEGSMALVDYEYFSKALLLLFEVLSAQKYSEQISITASETGTEWQLDFVGIIPELMKIFQQMHQCKTQPESSDFLSTENILRLQIICEVLHLQDISVNILEAPVLRLSVPTTNNS